MLHNNHGEYPKALETLDPLYKVAVSNYGETHEMSLLVAQRRVQLQARMRLYKITWVSRLFSRMIQLRFDKEHIEAAQAQFGNNHPYTISAIDRGINTLAGTLRYEEAITLAECAVNLVEKRSGKSSYEADLGNSNARSLKRFNPMRHCIECSLPGVFGFSRHKSPGASREFLFGGKPENGNRSNST
jgi:hypothetical protein